MPLVFQEYSIGSALCLVSCVFDMPVGFQEKRDCNTTPQFSDSATLLRARRPHVTNETHSQCTYVAKSDAANKLFAIENSPQRFWDLCYLVLLSMEVSPRKQHKKKPFLCEFSLPNSIDRTIVAIHCLSKYAGASAKLHVRLCEYSVRQRPKSRTMRFSVCP